jgi:hypothetical protein
MSHGKPAYKKGAPLLTQINNPKAMLPVNNVFEPGTRETRIESLRSVFEVLETRPPVNLNSPVVIIAPTPVHNLWRDAAREAQKSAKVVRYIEYKNVHDFTRMIPYMEIQWVIIMDDIYPDQRPKMRQALRALNQDLGHRMFTVTPEYKVPVNPDTQALSLLGLKKFEPTNPYSIPDPDENS